MLKRTIKYIDFDDVEQEEDFYFNISKPELIELEVDQPGGFGAWMEEVMKAKDNKTLMAQFKRILLLAVGEKTPDGRNFVKTEEIKAKFASSAAYISLYTEMATDDKAAADFLLGTLPRDMVVESRKKIDDARGAVETVVKDTNL